MFTEKPLRASKNTSKGLRAEKLASQKFHSQIHSVPILISAKFLRRLDLGQVDIAVYSSDKIQLIEVKSSSMGVKACKEQRLRLFKSTNIMAMIFNKPATLSFYSGKEEKLGNHFLS